MQVGTQRWMGGACAIGAAQLGRELDLCTRAGQRALRAGLGQGLQGLRAAGHWRAQRAVERGGERHGRLGLQRGQQRVAALCQRDLVHRQAVLLAVVAVGALQLLGDGAAGPVDAVRVEGQLDPQRQHQLLQRRSGRLLRAGHVLRRDEHLRGPYLAQAQLAAQQRRDAPGDARVVHLHGQRGAAPAQPANRAARAQRAAHVARLQALPLGQVLRRARQCAGQRGVAAGPPPQPAQQHQRRHEQAPQRGQHPAPGAAARRRPRRGRRACGVGLVAGGVGHGGLKTIAASACQ